jgi:hypothetical protein
VRDRPDVTVSIVNHGNRAAVLRGLRALRDDTSRTARIEVVVVDNASEDGSAAAIRAEHPEADLIENRFRAGFGANHDRAAARAAGRHLLLLNDDTVVLPGAIDGLVDHLDHHPSAGIVAPRVVDAAGRPRDSAWALPSARVDLLGALTLQRRPRPQSRGGGPRAVGWAMGCCLLVRADAFRAVGGFDEGFYMYSEEIDLCARLAARGLETHWLPSVAVVHEGQASTGESSPERAVEMARSRRRYWRLHLPRAAVLPVRLAVTAEFLVLAGAAAATGRPWRSFVRQARGCWTDAGRPGLRERAWAWNARQAAAPRRAP